MKTAEKLKAIGKILADSFKFNEEAEEVKPVEEAEKVKPVEEAEKVIPQEFSVPKTAEELKAILEKFAEGTPDERLVKMENMLKAVFENVFSWELREAEQKAARERALELYKTGFEEVKADLAEAKKKMDRQGEAFKLQNKALEEILGVIGEFAEAPAEEAEEKPADKPFSKRDGSTRASRVENLYKNLVAAAPLKK